MRKRFIRGVRTGRLGPLGPSQLTEVPMTTLLLVPRFVGSYLAATEDLRDGLRIELDENCLTSFRSLSRPDMVGLTWAAVVMMTATGP